MDFSSLGSPTLTFDVAYALYSQTGFSDTLRVQVSSDCGATWTNVYNKFGQNLTTVTPYYQATAFTASTPAFERLHILIIQHRCVIEG